MRHDAAAAASPSRRAPTIFARRSLGSIFWRATSARGGHGQAAWPRSGGGGERARQFQKIVRGAGLTPTPRSALWEPSSRSAHPLARAPGNGPDRARRVQPDVPDADRAGGDQQGYLRPETAQGIFLNFKFCLEQNAGADARRRHRSARPSATRSRRAPASSGSASSRRAGDRRFCRRDPKKPTRSLRAWRTWCCTLFSSPEQLAAAPVTHVGSATPSPSA